MIINNEDERKLVIIALLSSLLLAALDQTIVATALPKIASDLKGASSLSWVISVYLLSSTIVTPIYGKLGDLYGRKRMLIIAVLVFLGGSLLCGISSNFAILVIARFIQGLGAGGLFPLVLGTISDIVPLAERGKYQAYFGVTFGASSILGPILGGTLTDILSWRFIFFINIPVGILSIFLLVKYLNEMNKISKPKIDYLGAVLLSTIIGIILFITVLSESNIFNVKNLILSILAVLLIFFFILTEKKAKEPILELNLFKNKSFLGTIVVSLVTGASLFGVLVYLSIYIQVVLGYSSTKAGLALLPLTLGLFPSSMIAGRKVSNSGYFKKYLILGFSVLSIAIFSLTFISSTTNYFMLASSLLLVGIGLGFLIQIPNLVATSIVEKKYIGIGASTVTFFRQIGATVSTAIFGSILNIRLSERLNQVLSEMFNKRVEMPTRITSFEKLNLMPSGVRDLIIESFARSIGDIFKVSLILSLVGLVVALVIPNIKLKGSKSDSIAGE